MKTRICFVGFGDDRPEALQLLKQAMGDAWYCTFVMDGPQALAAAADKPFDAVVSYLYLTGMSGAELLRQIGQIHPRTLRFVIGDISDEESALNCISGPHQFVVQPCKPDALVSAVQRSVDLNAKVFSDQFRTFAGQLQNWPNPPSTYFQILQQIESNAGLQSISETIARDEAVNTRLLQMVNSPAFGFGGKITDPGRVVALLGIDALKTLVLCTRICSESDDAKRAGISLDKFWEHSFRVASLAREMTMAETFDTQKANEAFAAGLLHNVGKMVLASNIPREYASVIAAASKHGRPLHEQEATQLGATHAQVGAHLLSLWGLPLSLVKTVALHLTPGTSAATEFSPVTAVHVANVFAHEKEASTNGGGVPAPKLDRAQLDALVSKEKLDAWRQMVNNPVSKTPTPPRAAKASPQPAPAATEVQASSPEKSDNSSKNNWVRWVLAPTTAVIVLGGILWWTGKSKSGINAQARTDDAVSTQEVAASSEPQTNLEAPMPAPAPSASQTNTAPVIPIPQFDSVKIQCIFYSATNSTVVINGRSLRVGQKIRGLEVIAITQTNTTLGFGKERRVFEMN